MKCKQFFFSVKTQISVSISIKIKGKLTVTNYYICIGVAIFYNAYDSLIQEFIKYIKENMAMLQFLLSVERTKISITVSLCLMINESIILNSELNE